ncbi:MAG: orotate phosphoribosyltransferase [Persicimonas sp.]
MNLPHDEREELIDLLVDRSLREGDFELSSGKSASVYVDVKQTVLSGRGAALTGRALWSLLQKVAPSASASGGLTLGADPLVTAIAMAAWEDGVDFGAVLVRKEAKGHGTQRFVEHPDTIEAGDVVVAVDDVVTTGGSTLTAIERMRKAGLVVEDAICVVDREDVGAERLAAADVTLHPLFSLSELVERRGTE